MLIVVFTDEKDNLSYHNLISDNVKKPLNCHNLSDNNEVKKLMMSVYFSVASDGLVR